MEMKFNALGQLHFMDKELIDKILKEFKSDYSNMAYHFIGNAFDPKEYFSRPETQFVNQRFDDEKLNNAWTIYYILYKRMSTMNPRSIVSHFAPTLSDCQKLKEELEIQISNFTQGEKETYWCIGLNGYCLPYKTFAEASEQLSKITKTIQETKQEDFIERLSIYTRSLRPIEYEDALKEALNNDIEKLVNCYM